ncbi:hypothetical protein [Microcoleus vaginatus]|uniref:hypothetical protein n=1 Tax=Microcoleus vaginatus TaxID=119532 RepID=UPI00403F784B
MSKISKKIRSAAAQLSQMYKPSLALAKSVLIASAAVTLSLIGAKQLGLLEPIELSAYDQMVRWRPRRKARLALASCGDYRSRHSETETVADIRSQNS